MAEQTVAKPQTVPARTAETEAQAPETREETRYLRPPVDIYETRDGLAVLVDMPGVEKDQVEVRVEDGLLTIIGHNRYEPAAEALYTEFTLSDFYRQFQLSDEVDQGKIRAELKHGVLKITLPKAEKALPRQIEVKVA